MASTVPRPLLERFRTEPTAGAPLVGLTGVVWIAGALYCSGYERLLSGLDNWPGSLVWSAVAVLPWLALFEWSKSQAGRHIARSPLRLTMVVAATAIASLTVGWLIVDGPSASLALASLRRLPAAGVGLLLILWSRAGADRAIREIEGEANLASLAASIDWIEAADNYVELHVGARSVMRRLTMREAERALAGRGFIRIHRRFLVNGRRISAIAGTSAERVVRLSEGTELPVGRAFAANLTRAA